MTADLDVSVLAPPPENGGIGRYADQLGARVGADPGVSVAHYPLFEGQSAREYVGSVRRAASGDVVHVQFEYGLFRPRLLYAWVVFPLLFVVSRSRGVPVVVTVHEVWTPESVGRVQYAYVWLVHAAVAWLTSCLVFMTRGAEADFRPRRAGTTRRIQHGVDVGSVREVDRSAARAAFGLDDEDVVVSQVGYVSPRKGTDTFLGVAERHPDYEFLVAGGPLRAEDEPYFERVRERAPGNVRVTGELSDEDFHRAFVATDVAVLAYRDIRQSGILNWCFAYGVPAVCRAIDRFEELADLGAPLVLFDGDDPSARDVDDALAAALSDRDELAEGMAAYGAENDLSAVADEYRSLYLTLAGVDPTDDATNRPE